MEQAPHMRARAERRQQDRTLADVGVACVSPLCAIMCRDAAEVALEEFQRVTGVLLALASLDPILVGAELYKLNQPAYVAICKSAGSVFGAAVAKDPQELVEVVGEEGMGFREIMERVHIDIGPPIPSLEAFDQEITKFEEMKRELAERARPLDHPELEAAAVASDAVLEASLSQLADFHAAASGGAGVGPMAPMRDEMLRVLPTVLTAGAACATLRAPSCPAAESTLR